MSDQRPYYDVNQAKQISDQHRQDRISWIKRLLGFGTCEVRQVSDSNIKYLADYKPAGHQDGQN